MSRPYRSAGPRQSTPASRDHDEGSIGSRAASIDETLHLEPVVRGAEPVPARRQRRRDSVSSDLKPDVTRDSNAPGARIWKAFGEH